MKCKDCEYHSFVDGQDYCNSKNGKRNIVRISREQVERDIDCKWAHKEKRDKAESEGEE